MGAESYGIYAYVATWLTVLLIFSKMGIDTLLVRYVSTYHAKKQWAELRGLRRRGDQIGLGSSVVIAALVVGIVWGLQDSIRPELQYAFYATAGLLPILTLVHFRKAIIQAFKRPALSQLPLAVIRPFGLLVLDA
jgi:O-antigen/teichoic acid export membrane protein